MHRNDPCTAGVAVSLARRTTAPDEAHSTWLGLSDEQRDVVRWFAPTTCVVTALAGSGKTRVAIEWINAHADNLRGAVLAISFTRRGAAELGSRLARVDGLGCRMIASTFDALLLAALRARRLIPPTLRTRASAHQEVDAVYEHVDSLLAGLSDQVWPSNARQWVRGLLDQIARGQKLDPEVGLVVGPLWERARRRLEAQGFMTCDTYRMLLDRHRYELVRYLRDVRHVAAIVVDESQDNSAAELRIVCALQQLAAIPLLLLGDPNQCVNSFRGAVGDVAGFLDAHGVAYEARALTYNFRSSEALVRCQNSLRAAGDHGAPRARATRRGGLPAVQLVVGSEELLVDAVGRVLELVGIEGAVRKSPSRPLPAALEQILETSPVARCGQIVPNDVRLLAPTNATVRDIASALAERGFPVAEAGTPKNPYESRWAAVTRAWFVPASGLGGRALTGAVCDVLHAHAQSWAREACTLEREEIATMLDALCGDVTSATKGTEFSALCAALGSSIRSLSRNDELVSHTSADYLGSVEQLLKNWNASVPLGELEPVLEGLLAAIPDMRRRPARRGERRVELVDRLGVEPVFFAAIRRTARRPGEVTGAIDELARSWRRRDVDEEDDCVLAMTIHASKALTIPIVIEVHGERVPYARGPERSTRLWPLSELSVAYVSLSRASELFVSVCVASPGRLHREPLEGWQYAFLGVEPRAGFRARSGCCPRGAAL